MLRLKFWKDGSFPDLYYADLVLRDDERHGGTKAITVASVQRRDARPDRYWWQVYMMPPGVLTVEEAGASFDREEFERPTLNEAKQEIAARLFIGVVGRREGGGIRRIS